MPSPLVLLLVTGVLTRREWMKSRLPLQPGAATLTVYAFAWFFVFMLPVLPLEARSELYLYLPVFGFCLLAGSLAENAFARSPTRSMLVTAGVCVVALGGYQVSRAMVTHNVLTFSEKLAHAIQDNDAVGQHSGSVVLVPGDANTDRLLRNAVGGYLDVVLRVATGRRDIGGAVAYAGEPVTATGLRLTCLYRDGEVSLRPVDRPQP